MNLNRPGDKQPDGVILFDKPVHVLWKSDGKKCETYAEGYNPLCRCGGDCVYINPWPIHANDRAYAVRSHTLTEL